MINLSSSIHQTCSGFLISNARGAHRSMSKSYFITNVMQCSLENK